MADLFAKQATLAADPTFKSRVELAMYDAMIAVMGEAQGVMGNRKWQKRQIFAKAVLDNPLLYLDRFTKAIAEDSAVAAAIATPVAIASSTNATPTVITTAVAHGLAVGDTAVVANHAVNTNANGSWIVSVVGSSTTFTIPMSANGAGVATGTATKQPSDATLQNAMNARIDKFAGVWETD